MGLLEANRPYERATRARLVLDLAELVRVEWATLEFYAAVRRIENVSSARRSLFRLKATLAALGVELEVRQAYGQISARFATPELLDLIEPDLRVARTIVERLEANRERREPDLEELESENDVLSPLVIRDDYRERLKSFKWIAKKYGLGMARLHRLVAATGPVPSRFARRSVEARRPAKTIKRALEAAGNGAACSVIASILDCSITTAQRFIKKHGFLRPRGRSRGS